MIGQTLAIVRNTFFESIRQPIMLVVLVAATLALIFSNLLAGFTMEDDQRMMIDLGLSTVFVCGALLAAFIATNVLNREIANRTVLTVIAKPVSRPLFVIGKFLGVAAALTLCTLYMGFVFLLVERHGVIQAVRDPVNWPVIVFGLGAGALGLLAGVWASYFYGKVFSSTVIVLTTPLAGLAWLLCLMFSPDFTPMSPAESFHGQLWIALGGVMMAILVLTAVAIAASTRLGQVMTLVVTMGVFMLGMLSDHFFGVPLEHIDNTWLDRADALGLTETVQQTLTIKLVTGEESHPVVEKLVATVPLSDMAQGSERLVHALCGLAYSVLPDFQAFWFSDSLTQGAVIPAQLVGLMVVYGLGAIVAVLALAVILFQRREVG